MAGFWDLAGLGAVFGNASIAPSTASSRSGRRPAPRHPPAHGAAFDDDDTLSLLSGGGGGGADDEVDSASQAASNHILTYLNCEATFPEAVVLFRGLGVDLRQHVADLQTHYSWYERENCYFGLTVQLLILLKEAFDTCGNITVTDEIVSTLQYHFQLQGDEYNVFCGMTYREVWNYITTYAVEEGGRTIVMNSLKWPPPDFL
jgi:hypothetical protein